MKTISIDVETFASADLGKCGVYKYAEAQDFGVCQESCRINLKNGYSG